MPDTQDAPRGEPNSDALRSAGGGSTFRSTRGESRRLIDRLNPAVNLKPGSQRDNIRRPNHPAYPKSSVARYQRVLGRRSINAS